MTDKNEKSSRNQEPEIKTVSYQAFKENFDDINKKLDLYKSLEGTSTKSSEGYFTVKMDDIKQITLGEYTSYTMVLEQRNPQNATFYNLTIEDKAGVPGMFITAYRPTQEWLEDKTKPFDGGITTHRNIDLKEKPEEPEAPDSGDGGNQGAGGSPGGGGSDSYPNDCQGEVITTTVMEAYPCACGDWPWDNCRGCPRSPHRPGHRQITKYECRENTNDGGSHDPDHNPANGGGDNNDDNNSGDPELHSITILMDDGSTVETPEYLTNMLSLNLERSQWLAGHQDISDKIYGFIATNQFSEEAKAFGKEAIGNLTEGGEMLSLQPFFKYPSGSNYEILYPKLTEYLKNKLPNVKDIPAITNAIQDITNLTLSQIKEDLQWGEGPTIKIIQLDNYTSDTGPDTAGLFDENNAKTLYLDIDFVNRLENEEFPDQEFEDAYLFFLGVTVLHEYVHYGDYLNGNNYKYPVEEGDLFETRVYGEDVDSGTLLFKSN